MPRIIQIHRYPGLALNSCRNCPSGILEEEAPKRNTGSIKLTKGQNGVFGESFEQATHPTSWSMMPNGSVTVCLRNFIPSKKPSRILHKTSSLQICLRRNYHLVIREKILNHLFRDPRKRIGEIKRRAFVIRHP